MFSHRQIRFTASLFIPPTLSGCLARIFWVKYGYVQISLLWRWAIKCLTAWLLLLKRTSKILLRVTSFLWECRWMPICNWRQEGWDLLHVACLLWLCCLAQGGAANRTERSLPVGTVGGCFPTFSVSENSCFLLLVVLGARGFQELLMSLAPQESTQPCQKDFSVSLYL